ncbi:MAG: acid-activated urea channel [Campylobacteraceae bacterium]|jgi:acid-activated urea channel|nr:acid-activated urea channel [Campylobacteraceae bacterium]
MGLLGVYLFFVCIALVSNGVAALSKIDLKSASFINIVTGGIIVISSFIMIGRADLSNTMAYNNINAGFLFGFTYLFIAANFLLKLDLRPFGWYSICVVVFALISAITCFNAGITGMAVLWLAWAVLWLEGFLELALGFKKLGKVFPYLSIAEGIFAAGVPSILMLFGIWQ